MWKEILKQRFVFAEIDAYRDHCKLSEKLRVVPQKTEYDTFLPWSPSLYESNVTLPTKENRHIKKNSHYFLLDVKSDENDFSLNGQSSILVRPYFKGSRRHLTTKDRQIKQHYAKPFTSITVHTHERNIIIKDNKLCVNISTYTKHRKVNSKFFKKNIHKIGFTIDLNNGNITTYRTDNRGLLRVRRNYFQDLKEVLNSVLNFEKRIESATSGYYLNMDNHCGSESVVSPNTISIRNEFKKNLNDYEFLHKLEDTFNIIPEFNDGKKYQFLINNESVIKKVVKIFTNIKKIKVPDEYHMLMVRLYPTKKFLKKNDNKLVSAILDRFGIKSKQTVKLLHLYPNMDISRLLKLKSFFGVESMNKYISNINHKLFSIEDYRRNHDYDHIIFNDNNVYDLNNNEKSNVIKLINEYVLGYQDSSGIVGDVDTFFRTISDHFNMIKNVRTLYPETELRSTTWKTFHQEHLNLSKLQRIINKGYSTEFIFDERMIKYFEEPITNKDGTFYPVILRKDIEYTEEGTHMHHCVGSYSENEHSLIISLRKNSNIASERVTCEFNTSTKLCIQSKYFCNSLPPEEFNDVLYELKDKISNYKYSIRSIDKVKKYFIEKDTADTLYQMMIENRLGEIGEQINIDF